eukprot:m.798866 g.798866  ORF g.798866 m.798866 type:complete len:79 (+) comp23352_c0_seq20:1732-1968(+)
MQEVFKAAQKRFGNLKFFFRPSKPKITDHWYRKIDDIMFLPAMLPMRDALLHALAVCTCGLVSRLAYLALPQLLGPFP